MALRIFTKSETEAAIGRNPSCGSSWDGVEAEIALMHQERQARGEQENVIVHPHHSNRGPAIRVKTSN